MARARAAGAGGGLSGKSVLIFGLGRHGGGAGCARYCARQGARVIVSDSKSEKEGLEASVAELRGERYAHEIVFHLGGHREEDVRGADVVIKNPAVPRGHPLLQLAGEIATDVSIFLDVVVGGAAAAGDAARATDAAGGAAVVGATSAAGGAAGATGAAGAGAGVTDAAGVGPAGTANGRNRIIAVTGTKGKSTTVAALAHACRELGLPAIAAGNIGTSVLDILDDITPQHIIILELSSFQLGDLHLVDTWGEGAGAGAGAGRRAAWPDAAICTNLLPDHQNYYDTMADYLRDKCYLAAGQGRGQWLVVNGAPDQIAYSREIIAANTAPASAVGVPPVQTAVLVEAEEESETDLPCDVRLGVDCRRQRLTVSRSSSRAGQEIDIQSGLIGAHNVQNIAMAGAALHLLGIEWAQSTSPFAGMGGVAYRLQTVAVAAGVTAINDSAATIPDAALAAVTQLPRPIYLIAGGSDKRLDLRKFLDIRRHVEAIYLLGGTATDKIIDLFDQEGCNYCGPYNSMDEAVDAAWADIRTAHQGESGADTAETAAAGPVLLLSPGCASFGLFAHEFDRGDKFNEAVARYA